jgi:glycosyltransferase involved in cell wall biosynthesis
VPLVQTYHTDLHAYAQAYRFPVPALRAGLRLYARRLGVPRPQLRPDDTAPVGRLAARTGRRRAALDSANVLLLGDADAVVVPTRAVLERISLPVPDETIHLVPTGVGTRPTSPSAVVAFRAGCGLDATDQVVLFVGRVNREKGVDLLLAAFERLVATCPRARLVMVGAVYEPRWFTGLLRAMSPGAAARVMLTGQQPPEVVAAAYASADVLAFPSRTDTQALVLQEAALYGVPAVLADAGLLRDGPLAGAGVGPVTAPDTFAAAVAAILLDPAGARRIGEAARRNAGRHTPARYAAAMLEVYRDAARHADRGTAPRQLITAQAPGVP